MTSSSLYLEDRETESNDSFDTANLLSPGVPLTAYFGFRDEDYYKVAAPRGSEVTFTFKPIDTYIGNTRQVLFNEYVSEATDGLSGLGWWGVHQPSNFGPLYTPSSGMVYVKLSSNGYGAYQITASINGGAAAGEFSQYSLSSSSSSVDEGGTVSIKIATRDLASGTSIPYKISGVSAADVEGNLSGISVFDASGFATVELTLSNDVFMEGDETLTFEAGGASITILVNDTSKSATYSLTNNWDSVDEGSTASFTLTTKYLAAGTAVPYTLSGVSAADVSGGLIGIAVVGSSGVATISVTLLKDNSTEGNETLTVTAGGASASTAINDTSVSATIEAVTDNVISGAVEVEYNNSPSTANLLTSGVAITGQVSTSYDVDYYKVSATAGDTIEFTLKPGRETNSGYNPDGVTIDFYSGLSGWSYGSHTAYYERTYSTIASDTFYAAISSPSNRHDYTLKATTTGGSAIAGGASASTAVNDTSVSATTYSLSNNSYSVNEGSTASFTLTTKNLAAGTAVPYTLSGVSAADVLGGLSGTAVVNSSGVATISVTLLNDNLTEGNETLTVTAGGASASTTVNDTGIPPNQ